MNIAPAPKIEAICCKIDGNAFRNYAPGIWGNIGARGMWVLLFEFFYADEIWVGVFTYLPFTDHLVTETGAGEVVFGLSLNWR